MVAFRCNNRKGALLGWAPLYTRCICCPKASFCLNALRPQVRRPWILFSGCRGPRCGGPRPGPAGGLPASPRGSGLRFGPPGTKTSRLKMEPEEKPSALVKLGNKLALSASVSRNATVANRRAGYLCACPASWVMGQPTLWGGMWCPRAPFSQLSSRSELACSLSHLARAGIVFQLSILTQWGVLVRIPEGRG